MKSSDSLEKRILEWGSDGTKQKFQNVELVELHREDKLWQWRGRRGENGKFTQK